MIKRYVSLFFCVCIATTSCYCKNFRHNTIIVLFKNSVAIEEKSLQFKHIVLGAASFWSKLVWFEPENQINKLTLKKPKEHKQNIIKQFQFLKMGNNNITFNICFWVIYILCQSINFLFFFFVFFYVIVLNFTLFIYW